MPSASSLNQKRQSNDATNHSADDAEIEKEIADALKKMEDAFHAFHDQIHTIQLDQKEIAKEIRKRIDQEKIDRIYKMLQQS